MARTQIGAVEAGRGHQHHAADAARGRGAAGLRYALDREAGRFGFAGPALQFGRRRNLAVEQIEIGKLACQQRRVGEADKFIVGRHARHRDRALGKFGDAIAGDVVGRNHRLALPDQHAQPDIVAFRALGFLDAPVTYLDALRYAAHRDRIGSIGAGALCRLDQALRQRRKCRLIEQVRGRGGAGKRLIRGW